MKKMKQMCKCFSVVFLVLVVWSWVAFNPSGALAAKAEKAAKAVKAAASFDAKKVSDMSDFDPGNPVIPTGDTIKIAVVAAFSGPSAYNGQIYFGMAQWVAHDINKRGGIMVDGKKKLIEVIKADHMSKMDQCKKITERMALQEKVHFFWGTDGSHFMKVINETAKKYKIIAINATCMSDDLQDAVNFSPYSFHATFSTAAVSRGMAYYYGQIRKKEKKFYILNQDYAFGHQLAEDFKAGLKEYYPDAQIVGEDFHKLFLTDYAPYLSKVKASGAEVIFTGDWLPDAGNLLKQARQMGIMLPFANIYVDEPNYLHETGVEGTKGLVNISAYYDSTPFFKTKDQIRVYTMWKEQQKKWKTPPYSSIAFQHFTANAAGWVMTTYWAMSVLERAKSLDPEKIIKVWENDSFEYINGKVVKMRACDHKAIMDLGVTEYVPPEQQKVSMNIPPFYWFKGASYTGPVFKVPAAKILPWMDQKLDRCKGKNDWGE
ncbi:MAG: branched-chain amino acid ABC transporter substrate-binding protein [Deltaproteobacteria bacterium]|nr:branched-chain amino acid ABC transporter substrate-binding protein [Deltaproteobacteria bacterium]